MIDIAKHRELEAARECVAVLRQAYEVGAIADWFDIDDDAGERVLDAYHAATKGER